MYAAQRSMSAGRAPGETALTDAAPFSVLLVEDDDVAAEAIKRGLRKHASDHPVVIAEDGAAALQILRGEHATLKIGKPHLVLLDLNLSGMSGFEFLRQVRSDEELRPTLVFVLSTSDATIDRARAYQENIAGFMVKSDVGPQSSGLARFLKEYGLTNHFP
jgi:CheY-like chemotaxis protein